MPTLRHATTRANWEHIQTQGLLVSKADPTARLKGVWVHSASQSPWAVIHTMAKHHVPLEEVIVVELQVPERWLTRFRNKVVRRGIWYTTQDIPATRLTGRTWAGKAFGASASE